MVSYADFMTLLFALFVVLYSSSQVDKPRMIRLSNAITAGFQQLGVGSGPGAIVVIPGTTPLPATHPARSEETAEAIRPKLELKLAAEIASHTISLRDTSEGLVLSLRELGFFDSGSATLRASSMNSLDRIGSVLASVGSNLRVEGHTDNVPIHTPQFQSNWNSPPRAPPRSPAFSSSAKALLLPAFRPPVMPSTTPSPITPAKTDAASIAASISSSSRPIGSAILPRSQAPDR